jgi:transposase
MERDLLAAGENITRVPPKLMAHARDAARTYGKSDPIDAFAVARAALRHPDLPIARLDGPSRDVRLLVDHREDLVGERTRMINRLRWHLHELDPDLELPTRLNRYASLDRVSCVLTQRQGIVAKITAERVERIRELTARINELERDLRDRISQLAPTLVARTGCGHLTAAKIVAETADVTRFRSRDAYAAHNGTAPLPVWSGNRYRHRLSRVGNRQLNAAIHRIAITAIRVDPASKAYLEGAMANGKTKTEALRLLKRRISNAVYRDLRTDAQPTDTVTQPHPQRGLT